MRQLKGGAKYVQQSYNSCDVDMHYMSTRMTFYLTLARALLGTSISLILSRQYRFKMVGTSAEYVILDGKTVKI